MSNYAYEIGKEYTLDYYFVGEYNREVFSTIHNWVRKKSRNSILIVEGLSGVGKSYCTAAAFDKEGLRGHVKVISGEVFLDLLIKKVSNRNDSYSSEKYEKTFEPSDFIVVDNINYLIRVLGTNKCKNLFDGNVIENKLLGADSCKEIFDEIVSNWINSGSSIVFTVSLGDDYCQDIVDFLKPIDVTNVTRVKIEMPTTTDDKENIIKKALQKNKMELDQKKYYEVLNEAFLRGCEPSEMLNQNKDSLYYEKSMEDYTLTDDEMKVILNRNYNSIRDMYTVALKMITDRGGKNVC